MTGELGGRGGLYDGFEGYRTPTSDEFRDVLTGGLVVVDTNVLLNLYRYNEDSRTAMIDVLRALGDRFWIPHQVMKEFWRNRERALVSPADEVAESVRTLGKQRDATLEVLSQWVNRGALSDTSAGPLRQSIEESFDGVIDGVETLVDLASLNEGRNTAKDPVLGMLEPVLDGRVGPEMPAARYTAAVTEGKRRAEAGEPPGFGDAKAKTDKGNEGPAGDYLVWEQLLIEAEKSQTDVVLVTGDVNKGDWWRREGSFTRGPRNELVQELKRRAGKQLFMLRPEELLAQARAVLSVDVKEESVQDVERVDRALSPAPTAGHVESTGWSRAALDSLLLRLSRVAPVQSEVLQFALSQGGFVSREDVYRIGDYEQDRQLKGFTRPINRLVQHLRDDGTIPEDAVDVLQPVYDKGKYGFGWADGFRVPAEVCDLYDG